MSAATTPARTFSRNCSKSIISFVERAEPAAELFAIEAELTGQTA
jgi:hypothetical protein